MRRILFWTGILILLDQITKWWFFDLQRGADTRLITPVFNHGSGRSLPIPLWILILCAFGISALIISLVHQRHLPHTIALFVLAGARGNTLDRILLGGVRDFIDLHYRPIFNLADIYLTMAGVLVLILRRQQKGGKQTQMDTLQ